MNLLIVEDEITLSAEIRNFLEKEGFVCDDAHTGRIASDKIFSNEYDPIAEGSPLLHPPVVFLDGFRVILLPASGGAFPAGLGAGWLIKRLQALHGIPAISSAFSSRYRTFIRSIFFSGTRTFPSGGRRYSAKAAAIFRGLSDGLSITAMPRWSV